MDNPFYARTYLTHFPVQSYLEADVLSKESTWNILEYARRAVARGVTAEEMSKALNLPASVVYSTLKELRRLGFVFIYPREKVKAKGRHCGRVVEGVRGVQRKEGVESISSAGKWRQHMPEMQEKS